MTDSLMDTSDISGLRTFQGCGGEKTLWTQRRIDSQLRHRVGPRAAYPQSRQWPEPISERTAGAERPTGSSLQRAFDRARPSCSGLLGKVFRPIPARIVSRMAAPEALVSAFDRWIAAGRPAQVASPWNRKSWTSRLPNYRDVFDRLGDKRLTREAVAEWARHIETPKQAVDAFIVTMVWSYGPVGYGAFRTARVIEGPGFETAIFESAQVAATSGGLAAYRHVSERRRADPSFLRYLGPAFGTKFIYFVTKANASEAAPVMDAVVQRWFQRHVPSVPLTLEWSSPQSYEQFLGHVAAWASELAAARHTQVAVDDVEQLIFADGATAEGSAEWSETWSGPSTEVSPSELLERLENSLDKNGVLDEAQPHLEALRHLVFDVDRD